MAFTRPISLTDENTRFCPGCGHGILTRIVAEVVDSLGIREKTIGIAPVGCGVFHMITGTLMFRKHLTEEPLLLQQE